MYQKVAPLFCCDQKKLKVHGSYFTSIRNITKTTTVAKLLHVCASNKFLEILLRRAKLCLNYLEKSFSTFSEPAKIDTAKLLFSIVLYCIVSMHLYNAFCSSTHQSEALPVRETQREESSLERTKRD